MRNLLRLVFFVLFLSCVNTLAQQSPDETISNVEISDFSNLEGSETFDGEESDYPNQKANQLLSTNDLGIALDSTVESGDDRSSTSMELAITPEEAPPFYCEGNKGPACCDENFEYCTWFSVLHKRCKNAKSWTCCESIFMDEKYTGVECGPGKLRRRNYKHPGPGWEVGPNEVFAFFLNPASQYPIPKVTPGTPFLPRPGKEVPGDFCEVKSKENCPH